METEHKLNWDKIEKQIENDVIQNYIEKHGKDKKEKITKAINLYFECVHEYPTLIENGKLLPSRYSKNPDHDRASRITGIFSDYILRRQEYYIIKQINFKNHAL